MFALKRKTGFLLYLKQGIYQIEQLLQVLAGQPPISVMSGAIKAEQVSRTKSVLTSLSAGSAPKSTAKFLPLHFTGIQFVDI